MKKILYLGNFRLPDLDAASHRVLNNARALRDEGNEVVFISAGKENKISNIDGFITYFFRYVNFRDIIEYYYLPVVIKKNITNLLPKFDVIILYNAPSSLIKFCLTLKNKNSKLRIVSDCTEWYSNKRNIFKRLDTKSRMEVLNKKVDGIIAISPYLYNYYKKSTITTFIPPLVTIPRNLGTVKLNTKNNFVFFGTISKDKERLDIIIKTFSITKENNLYILGVSEETQKAFTKTTTFKENIHFLGRLSHQETLAFVNSCDALILLRDDNVVTKAGFSTKFAEAATLGLPIVTNYSEVMLEYKNKGVNIIFVYKNEINSLKIVLDNLISMRIKKSPVDIFSYSKYRERLSLFLEDIS